MKRENFLSPKEILKWLWYIGLLAIGCFFILDVTDEYLIRKTSFSIDTENLTYSDLPTIVICFKHSSKYFQYGRHLNISHVMKKRKIQLSLGDNRFNNSYDRRDSFSYSIYLSELHVEQKPGPQRFCFKISHAPKSDVHRKRIIFLEMVTI